MTFPIDHYYPPAQMPFVWVHLWATVVGINFLVCGLAWPHVKRLLSPHPGLVARYRRRYWALIFCMNLPWLLMGAGIVFGKVGSIINFGVFWQPNPVVLAWWVLIAALSLSGILWLGNGGAGELAQYPRLPMVPVGDPGRIKRYLVPNLLGLPLFFTLWQNTKVMIHWMVENPRWIVPSFGSIIAVLVLFCALMIFLGYQTTDWAALAKYYKTRKKFRKKWLSGPRGSMEFGSPGLKFGLDDKGLHLFYGSFNRIGRPPLYAPWGDISSRKVKTKKSGFFLLHFKKVPLAVIPVSFKTAWHLCQKSRSPRLAKLFPMSERERAPGGKK